MELFTRLFGHVLAFVYHCFDRIVIHGYLTGLSRPEHVVHFFREVGGAPVITKEILSERSGRIEARTGLRMMPTFPRSPLSAGQRVFPSTAGRLAYQAGPSQRVNQLKPAPGMR
jgi:hypothetical protein